MRRITLFAAVALSAAAQVPDKAMLDLALEPPLINTSPGPEYDDAARPGNMVLGIDRTPKGRLWAAWVGNGDSPNGFFMLASSDDGGKTWSKPRVVIDPTDPPNAPQRRALVGNLWTDPLGRLWCFFDQSLGYFDGRCGDWYIRCDDPDAAEPVWTKPVRFADGCTLNKPTVLSNGDWLLPVSLWTRDRIGPAVLKEPHHDLDGIRMANVFASTDQGKTWTRRGCVAFPDTDFDEHMIVERKDGNLWMLARTKKGISESFSTDKGATWSAPQSSAIQNVSARFFIRRLASGNLLLVKNGPIDLRLPRRSNMTAFISGDDGSTWGKGLLLDDRSEVSYPDGFQAPDGTIHILYDWNRHSDAEILLTKFREEDVARQTKLKPALVNKALAPHLPKAIVPDPKWSAQAAADAKQDFKSIPYDGVTPNKMVCDTTLRELPDGSWILFMLAGGDTEPSPLNYTGVTRSKDMGKTWTPLERYDVGFPREGKTIGQGPTELMITGQRATLFFSTHSKDWGHDWRSWFLTSDDSFKTWGKPFEVPGRLKERTFIRKHIVTHDGRILIPFQHYVGPDDEQDKAPLDRAFTNPRNGVLISKDGGKTWSEHGNIRLTPNDRYFGWAENDLFEHPDGSITMVIRGDGLGGMLYKAESKDGGKTWPEFASITPIPNPGSKTTLYNLGGDTVAILHNPNSKHRSPMALWISFDGMKTWPYQRVLQAESVDGPKGRMNYPDGFVSKDKQWLHFAFDDNRHRAVHYSAKLPPLKPATPVADRVPEEKEIVSRFGNPDNVPVTLPAFKDGKFSIGPSEVVVFAGQTNLVREQKTGELEAVLATAFAQKSPSFRSMAWEGDTVYEQWRDLNFGAWKAQLDAVGASVVVAQFGQVESFDGVAKLPQFASAYHRLIDQFSSRTPRLVLISPMPFEKPVASHAPDLTLRNADVKAYADAVRDIAKQRGAVFVDLFTPLSKRDASLPRITDNGLHLNEEGLRIVAQVIAQQLGASFSEADNLSALRTAIVEKNRLFFDTWRPANWSFVYGDRISQKFGKPSEVAPSLKESFEARKPMVAKLDANIQAIARGEKVAPFVSAPPEPVKTPPVISVADELASFTVADGYEINLFASEELGVAKPTQITWDERGRMYVACSSTYPQTVPGVKPSDYILVLEDSKHTGRADKSHKFAEGLTMVQGLEPGEGGLFVCDFDQIIHLRDTNGDGKADTKRVLFSGFGIGDTHQLANSITHGPDGSLWFTQGLHAFSRVETAHGLAVLEKAGVWRLSPRTQKMEGYFNGGKAGHNCWGVAFDDFNQVFHKSGDRPDGYYTVPGMVSIKDPDEYHGVGNLFFTNPKTTSIDFIGTRALPDDIQGCALIGGYFGNVVELHRLKDDGSGFKSEQLPKLVRSSSTAFRPVDVSIGPDGAMYLADWFNPVIGHYQASYADPQRDRTHGRIWRISAKGRASVKQPDLASMTPKELLEQLRSPERWTRYQAKRLLFDAPSVDVLKAADDFVSKNDDERMLMEVCGIFEAHESPRPALLTRLLAAKDARVRAYGARVTGYWADRLPDALALLGKSIRDEHPRVRLESIVACSHVLKPEAVAVATQALDSPRDKFIDYALAQVVKSLKPQFVPVMNQLKLSDAHLAFVKKIANASPVTDHPGKIIYDALCLNCHQPTGLGLPDVYPPLAGSDWVAGDAATLGKIVVHGLNGPIKVKGEDFKQVAPIPMPPMGLNDQQIADVLTYIRSSFGNKASAVQPADIKAVREANSTRSVFWTSDELKK